jgi:hypothetical protein
MQRQPFDPSDPFDVISDRFRIGMAELGAKAFDCPDYRALDSSRQLEAFLCGSVTGLIGVVFAHITPEGRDALMEEIVRYLPLARQNAEGMLDDDEPQTRKH